MNHARRLPIAALVFLLLAHVPVEVSAGTITDAGGLRTYGETFATFSNGGAIDDSWYDVAAAGSGFNFVVGSSAIAGGGKAWQVQDGGVAYTAAMVNVGGGVNACTTSQSLEFDAVMPDLPDTATAEMRVQTSSASATAAPLNSAGVRFTGTATADNEVRVFVRGGAGAAGTSALLGSIAGGTAFHVVISQGTCTGTPTFLFQVGSFTTGQAGAASDPIGVIMNTLAVAFVTAPSSKAIQVDNYAWNGAPIAAPGDDGVTASGIANSGTYSELYVSGTGPTTLIVAAHRISTGQIVVSKSVDNGTTWTDHPTGVTPAANTATRVVALDANRIAVMFRYASGDASCSTTLCTYIVKTTNGGTSWSPVSIASMNSGACVNGGVYGTYWSCNLNNFGGGRYEMDMKVYGTDIYATRAVSTGLTGAPSYGPAGTYIEMWRTTDFFVSASSVLGQYFVAGGQTANQDLVDSAAIVSTTCLIATLSTTTAGSDYNIRPVLCTGVATVQDPIAPLSNYGFNLRASYGGAPAAITFQQGGAAAGNAFHAGIQQADLTWKFSSLGTMSTLRVGSVPVIKTGTFVGFAASPTSTTYNTQLYKSESGVPFAPAGVAFGYGTPTTYTGGIWNDCAGAKARIFFSFVGQASGKLTVKQSFTLCPGTTTPDSNRYVFNTENYFCSERGAERFGYNYKEGVTFNDNPSSFSFVDIGDAYLFQGDEDDFDYLGKTIPASKGAKVFFQIEASTDNLDSVFRTALSFVNTASYDLGAPNHYLNGPDDPGDNAKGDGLDEGVFEEYIEVRFLEEGDDWNIAIFHVSQANNVEDRTKIGQSFLGDNPGAATSYQLILDTVAGYISVRHGDGTQIGSSIVDPLNVSLPSFFLGDSIYSQWFVGYGTAGVINTAGTDNAITFLDNKDEVFASTCIYLLREVTPAGVPVAADPACIGNCGAAGPVLVPSPNGTVPEGTTPNNGLPPPSGGGDDSTSGAGLVGGTLFNAGAKSLAESTGGSEQKAGFILGSMLVLAITVAVGGSTAMLGALFKAEGKALFVWFAVGATLGLIVGPILAYSFDLWLDWVLFVWFGCIVVAGVLAVVFYARKG